VSIRPNPRQALTDEVLCSLYSLLEGDSNRLLVAGWPARDSSGRIGPEMREIRDSLLADGLIVESASGSLGLTAKGVGKAERLFAGEQSREIDAPYPTTREGIREDLDYWVRRQPLGDPGSIYWEQVGSRINHLRYLDQRIVEEQKIEAMKENPQQSTTNIAHGTNARISVNSSDNSVNIVVNDADKLFKQLKGEIDKHIADESTRETLKISLGGVESAVSKESAYERYAQFVALVANHATLLPILGPYLGQLTHWIGTLK